MNNAPTIKINEEIVIRQPRQSDIEERYKLGRSMEFRKMVGGSVEDVPPYEYQNAVNLYHREMKVRYSWFIEYQGRMIGVCRIRGVHEKKGRYSIGIYDDTLYSKGIGTLVTKAIIDFAFKKLHLELLELIVLEFNERAIRCYEKSGFEKVKVLKDSIEIDGKMYNDVLMEIKNDKH